MGKMDEDTFFDAFGEHTAVAALAVLEEKNGKKVARRDASGRLLVELHEAFPDMLNFHPDVQRKEDEREKMLLLSDLCRKLPFPYSSMTGPECWSLPAVLEKEAYFNEFQEKGISEEEYQQMIALSERTQATSFLDTHNTYLDNDIFQLAAIVTQQRKVFHEICGLDPLHYLGMPGAAFQACLKLSGAVFQNITRECLGSPELSMQLMTDVNENIRGGLSCAFIPLLEANNPSCQNYRPCDPEEHVWIGSVDATNLYGFCMTQPLPVGDYKRVEMPEDGLAFLHELIDGYTDESKVGYMLVVDFEVPEKLHDKFDFAPVSQRKVKMEELSRRQRLIKFGRLTPQQKVKALQTLTLPKSCLNGCEKLVPDLGPRTQGLHIGHAKLLKELGVEFTAVHRIWSFKQGRVLEGFIKDMAKRRREAVDESTKTTLKLIVNAMYGKFLERKERGKQIKIHTCPNKCRKYALKKTCNLNMKIQAHKDLPDGTKSFLGITAHSPSKATVLDTPRMVGWTVLEMARRHMYNFYYNVMKKIFGEKLDIAYMDTDSIHYRIK